VKTGAAGYTSGVDSIVVMGGYYDRALADRAELLVQLQASPPVEDPRSAR
jgi:hypothetical protein